MRLILGAHAHMAPRRFSTPVYGPPSRLAASEKGRAPGSFTRRAALTSCPWLRVAETTVSAARRPTGGA